VRRSLLLLVAVALVAAAVIPLSTSGGGDLVANVAAGRRAATKPGLRWRSCGGGYQCSKLAVPVDYRSPAGQTVELALTRRRARDRAHRIGSLVINYGGPGDPAAETLKLAGSSIPASVRDRFDLVAFDPRGTGASDPVDCIDDATADRYFAEDPTPDSPADLARFYAGTNSSVDLAKACVEKFGTWLAEIGTRNVARDMDRLRAALGDRKLTFLGYSYGTVLGAVYAQMFPTRVRAMILDSAVDLSSTPQEDELGNARGFESALDAFLADCASHSSCAFHSGGDPKGALNRLRGRFELGLKLQTADGRRAGEGAFYLAMIAALYDKRQGWPTLARALHNAGQGDGTFLQLLADSYTGRAANGVYDNVQEAIGPIRCADRRDARMTFDDYRATFEQYAEEFPFFGPLLAGSPIGCDARLPAVAPGEDLGDVRVTGAPPILIVGTTNDPATPYAGAQDLNRRIAGSRLLTFDSTEHGSYAKGIPCIDRAVDRYLLTLKLPAKGTRCRS
jgi:pimeloyl-ACP methyl ester carboxylesterase